MTLEREERQAARLVVLDAHQRILLFRHTDGHGQEFWATPGGGLEPGETYEDAARREAKEELGADSVELGFLWSRHAEFVFANRRVSQDETYFLVSGHGEILGTVVTEVHSREGIVDVRWWTLDGIETTNDVVFPPDLASRIRGLIQDTRRVSEGLQ